MRGVCFSGKLCLPHTIDLEQLCQEKGLRITEQRRVIAERRKRHLDARPHRSVYDYSTARWMYKHHGTRMLARLGQGADNTKTQVRSTDPGIRT